MLRIFNKKHQSFTLVEILVIITIIGILAGIILVAMGPARERAKDSRIESDMLQLQNLAENIYLDDSNYNNLNCSVIDEVTDNCTCDDEFLEAFCEDLLVLESSLTIEKSSTQYCAFVPLHSENNCSSPVTENFCVDSWGTTKKLGLPSGDYCQDNFICLAYFDIDNDGAISVPDLDDFMARYDGCVEGDDCYDPRADFNSTGNINTLDWNRLLPPNFCNI